MSGEIMRNEPFDEDIGTLDLPTVERLADEPNKRIPYALPRAV